MVAESKPTVCVSCLNIDFQALVQPLPRDRSPRLNRIDCNLQYTQGCAVCEILFPLHYKKNQNKAREITSRTFPDDVEQSPPGARSSFELQVNSSAGMSTGARVWCVHDLVDVDLYVQKTWDHIKAKSWLQECKTSHESRCGNSVTRVTNMSLIDCTTMSIVEADASSRWIALSYVWGDRLEPTIPAVITSLYVDGRLPSALPRTIEDAIVVTQQLGYRYLWVDEYCIDQQNKQNQHMQIAQMDEVYRGADLTIVAAAGEGKNHGLPGVNKTRRRRLNVVRVKDVNLIANSQSAPSHIWDARWFTRAWTLQEGLLSRRVLLFTNHQATYYCLTDFATEGLGEYLTTVHGGTFDYIRNARASLPTPRNLSKTGEALLQFKALLQLYTARNLTFGNDALNAFRGVMRDMRRIQPDNYSLCGLPFFGVDFNGENLTWAGLVSDAMAWYIRDHKDFIRRRRLFPSWTWAGWRNPIWFPALESYSPSLHLPVLNNIQLETSDGSILSETDLEQRNRHETFQDVLDAVTVLIFQAPMLSVEEYTAIVSEVHDSMQNSTSSNLEWHGMDSEMVTNLRSGKWSCFLVTVNLSGDDLMRNSLVNFLIARWKDDQLTAERVDAYYLKIRLPLEEVLGPIDNLERRRVRLV